MQAELIPARDSLLESIVSRASPPANLFGLPAPHDGDERARSRSAGESCPNAEHDPEDGDERDPGSEDAPDAGVGPLVLAQDEDEREQRGHDEKLADLDADIEAEESGRKLSARKAQVAEDIAQ